MNQSDDTDRNIFQKLSFHCFQLVLTKVHHWSRGRGALFFCKSKILKRKEVDMESNVKNTLDIGYL